MARFNRDRALRVSVVIVGIGIAAQLMVVAATNQDNDVAPNDLPAAIEQLVPAPGTVIRPQESISVDLQDDFVGVLRLDGSPDEIPEDQYDRVESLGRVTFRPGPDKDIEELEPGPHSATVTWWPKTLDRDAADTPIASYSWSFSVG